MDITTIVPVKGFSIAKERLAPGFEALDRAAIATATAGHVIAACVGAGTRTIVVTDDAVVADLAGDLGAAVVPDPGAGLDAATAAGMRETDGPWAVLHADLPLLDDRILRTLAPRVAPGRWLLAPSRDGGTNLLAGTGRFPTAYGPASFHRHLGRIAAAGGHVTVVVDEALAIEIDTPRDLAVAASRPGGRWLAPFLS